MTQDRITITPIQHKLQGRVTIPGDKSLSHRALILNSIAEGKATIQNLLPSEDVLCTKRILEQLGVEIVETKGAVQITGGSFRTPEEPLYCGNSGTTMRLMLGLLAPHSISVLLTGDQSLSRRPMRRVTEYLKRWGVFCEGADGSRANFAPIRMEGNTSIGSFEENIPIASAQMKSALALVALQSQGGIIRGGALSRDHTERMIRAMGGRCTSLDNGDIIVERSRLRAIDMNIPSDISSAAFFIALGLLIPDSDLCIPGINLNPTRRGFLDTIREMGAKIEVANQRMEGAEQVGDLRVRYSRLRGVTVPSERIPTMIDELPILSVLATQALGETIITGAEDLRHKESDRLQAIATMMMVFEVDIQNQSDGFCLYGPQKIRAGHLDSQGDHRIAMSGIVLASISDGASVISNVDCIATSFPSFLEKYRKIRGDTLKKD